MSNFITNAALLPTDQPQMQQLHLPWDDAPWEAARAQNVNALARTALTLADFYDAMADRLDPDGGEILHTLNFELANDSRHLHTLLTHETPGTITACRKALDLTTAWDYNLEEDFSCLDRYLTGTGSGETMKKQLATFVNAALLYVQDPAAPLRPVPAFDALRAAKVAP